MIGLLAQAGAGSEAGARALAGVGPDAATSPDMVRQLQELAHQSDLLTQKIRDLSASAGLDKVVPTRLDVFHGYMGVFVAAFLVALIATPLMRRLAIANGIVDRPTESRKVHRIPIAYLGGVAVYLGIMAGIMFAYTSPYHGGIEFHASQRPQIGLPGGVPISVLLGMTAIMLCGLLDDVVHIDPRTKIAGMLFAAAALATQDVGVKVAAGVIVPLARSLGIPISTVGGFETLLIPIPGVGGVDVVYWVGTAVIALFVLGACNASNLIDGLDGLLSGTTAISSIGLLVVALSLAITDDGPLDSARIILCLSLLGACLGFLPHNFNPANIFLGDTGSLLLGFVTIVIILTLGDTGKTHLVVAGLVIYALPIMDTTLAIVRRKVSGKRISDADDNHLHHMLKRALGVKGAVLVLYAIAAAFTVCGVALSEGRGRVTYALVLVFSSLIGITAFKIARKSHIEQQMAVAEQERARKGRPSGGESSGVPGAGGQAAEAKDGASVRAAV